MILMVDCSQEPNWSPVPGDITTRWASKVKPNKTLQEYPRPQFTRNAWKNLNGLWEYAIRPNSENPPDSLDGKILVPFPIESALSGVKKTVGEANKLWYRRTFKVPKKWTGKRIILHFGAVDWETTAWINGREAGSHRGGYDAFSFDITDYLLPNAQNELLLSVWDPTDRGNQPRGKQVSEPHSIWYTSVTGIWQTVWLEPVPEIHIKSVKIIPDVDRNQVKFQVMCSGTRPNYQVKIQIKARNKIIAAVSGVPFDEINAIIENPVLWSPDAPFLYDVEIELQNSNRKKIDQVGSYLGMRKISLGKDEKGITQIHLNNKNIFMHGFLDQGWWPDGLYTAPTDEALRFDIEVTKQLGFNCIRKHVKIEPDRWYYWCDRLGVLVWQDMPSGDKYIGGNDPDLVRTQESAFQFKAELKAMIDERFNHPAVVMWVPFNEGWGQFETESISRWIKSYDPTRLVNSASGWTDRGFGDVNDIHRYPGPGRPENEPNRAAVLGEYGGLGLPVLNHTWRKEKNWGYRGFETTEELTQAYQDLTRKLLPMIEQGLCAAIYTQTTDVEIEVNGLMTYNREVIKINPEIARQLHQGYFSPQIISDDDIFLDHARIEMKAANGGEIRYTLDGSEPTQQSPRYSEPIFIKNTTLVKAKSFWKNGSQSLTTQYSCTKVTLTDPVPIETVKPGLIVHYYEGEWDVLPDFSALAPVFSKTADEINLKLSPRQQDFALRFEGFIRIAADGIYTFFTNSDDGTKLFVSDQLIVSNDGLHGTREESGKIALKAGLHKIAVEFFQKKGGLGLEVTFKGNDIEKQPIPVELLFY